MQSYQYKCVHQSDKYLFNIFVTKDINIIIIIIIVYLHIANVILIIQKYLLSIQNQKVNSFGQN